MSGWPFSELARVAELPLVGDTPLGGLDAGPARDVG